MESNLVLFYGRECPHSKKVEKIVLEFEKRFGKILKLEVWHDSENKKTMKEIPEFRQCNGTPFFFNKDNKKFICGECNLDQLEDWAT